MRISNIICAAILTHAAADEIQLDGGRKVTGTIATIQPNGTATIQTSFAKTPLTLRGETVRSILLSQVERSPADKPGQALVLANGDVLPGEVLGMDQDSLSFRSAATGTLEIPRQSLRAIRFGLQLDRPILTGENAFAGWSKSEAWKVSETGLTSTGVGDCARTLPAPLPKRFVLRCRVEWQGFPNLRIYFADDSLKPSGQADRYFLTVNHAGIELKRQASVGRTYQPLQAIQKTPDQFLNNGVDLEVRVDLENRSLQLFVDGEAVGTSRDKAEALPTGNGIMVQSSVAGNVRNSITKLELAEWSPGSDDPSANLPEAGESDSISALNVPDTMSGEALAIRLKGGKPIVVFKSPHSAQPLEVSTAATLTFRKPTTPVAADGPFRIELAAQGKLTVTACSLDPTHISCEHPLLGKLQLQRHAVSSIQRPDKTPTTTPRPSP